MKTYIQRIIAIIIEKTGIDPEDINEDSYFAEDLNIGAIELSDIFDLVEEEYHISFEKEEKEKIASVMDMVEIVYEKLE